MKKRCSDFIFIGFQIVSFSRKRYNLVLTNCDKRELKIGNNYGCHYIRMHVFYCQRKYEESFDSFVVLLEQYPLKSSLIEWGITLFIETPIVNEQNFSLAKARILRLNGIHNLNIAYKKKIKGILNYNESKMTSSL